MNRRAFLESAACLASAACLSGAEGPLRTHAAAHGLLYGAATAYGPLQNDPDYSAHLAAECNLLVPENVLKWTTVHPAPERFDFVPGDFLAHFAAAHDMRMRGHTLVWHEQLPRWFASTVTKQNARARLEEHIRTVMGHYRGRMHSWDVVNEAIRPQDGRADGLRQTPWLDLLGPEYLEIAYATAAEADPQALAGYNDYGLDYHTPEDEAKRNAVLGLLRRLKKQNVPVQAFGMQAHLSAGRQPTFQPETLRRFLGEVAGLGLKILITELDVSDAGLPDDAESRDRAVAAVYENYLTAALAEPAVVAVLTWGLTDKYTWLASRNRRPDGSPVRVLPLDHEFHRKPAWYAIAKALDTRR
ncbi:MAG TPA: endo-1,4-beta-xylanase [Bryobacteraceae bacterium]|nr:endo-1,4-beta-xylanase [Bryobacteraceae bacterium]